MTASVIQPPVSEQLSAVLRSIGEYRTESEAVAHLLEVVPASDWLIHREVDGWLLHPKPFSDGKLNLRVDVILEPTMHLLERGWRWGPVAIECKKAETNIGPCISQAIDYTRCVWRMPSGFDVMTRLCFLWHFKPPGGTVGSLMAQNRVGGAFLREYRCRDLVLMFNSTVAYSASEHGARVATDLRGGNKQGSR